MSDDRRDEGVRRAEVPVARNWDWTDKIPVQHRRLDAISRLINGGDVCTAVSFDKDRGCFVVAK